MESREEMAKKAIKTPFRLAWVGAFEKQASKAKAITESLVGRKNVRKFVPLWRSTAPARKYRAEENDRMPKMRARM